MGLTEKEAGYIDSMAKRKIKIAFVAEGMWHAAGMELVLSARANAMCNDLDITFITLDDGKRPDCFPMDSRVTRVYLNVKNCNECRKALYKYLTKHRHDITVSTGGMEFYELYKLNDGSRKIFEFHFSFDISKVWMAQTMSGIRLWLATRIQTARRVWIARHYDMIVALCKSDAQKWRRYTHKVAHIYNPLTIQPTETSTCENKKAIAVGRLHPQKGFDYLIDAWKLVHLQHPEWTLDIYGEGEQRTALQTQIDREQLADVIHLKGQTDDIVSKYVEASIFVLSSRDEAFGLVITEAESCGLPVVTFDCPSAPKELVEDRQNGFVVSLGDTKAMADRINILIENEMMRKRFARHSVRFSQRFSIDTIKEQWFDLYRQQSELLNETSR